MENNSTISLQNAKPELWGFKTLLSSSWQYYKALLPHLGGLIGLSFGVILVQAFVSVIGAHWGIQAAVSFFAFLASLILGFFIFLVSVFVLNALYEKKPVSVSGFLREGTSLAVPFTLTTVLTNLVMLGGYVLLIIPGVIASVWFSVSTFVVVLERKRGFNVLVRSVGLVRGYSWQVCKKQIGMVLLVMSILIISQVAVTLPLSLFFAGDVISLYQSSSEFSDSMLQEKVTAIASGPRVRLASTISNAWQGLIQLLVTPFPLCFLFLIYKNLKSIRGDAVAEDKRSYLQMLMYVGIAGTVLLFVIIAFVIFWIGQKLPLY